jgi:hypothetical protein
MWRDIKYAIADVDPSSFLIGLSYGMFTCLILAVYIALVVWIVGNKK